MDPTLSSASSIVSWQEEDEFIVEGLLNISWGLRRPIRLQMQDDHERIRPPPSSSSWHSGCNLGAQGWVKGDESEGIWGTPGPVPSTSTATYPGFGLGIKGPLACVTPQAQNEEGWF